MNPCIRNLNHQKLLVSPSILASDFSILGEEITRVETAGADLIHVDVMDGHFVPNLTLGPPVLKSVRKVTSLVLDTHLMISNPLQYAPIFVENGADHITFHVESESSPREVLQVLKRLGCTRGISLKPKTPAEAILPYLEEVDLVLVMTVEPGFGGQSFMSDMMPKVRTIRHAINTLGKPIHLQVDGGIDATTVLIAAENGANMMVAGTSVYKNPNGAKAAIDELRQAQNKLDPTFSL